MENTREYSTLTNLGAQLRLGFVKNMTSLADQFHKEGLIDDRCYESVTSTRSLLNDSEKAREMWQSVREQVKISTAYYNTIRSALSASKVHAALVLQMDAEYRRQGGAIMNTLADQPLAVHSGSYVWTKKVDMATLNIIKYYDTNNKKAVLRLLEEMAPSWADIGEMIGFSPAEIANVRQAGAGKTNRQYIHEIIARWMRNAPGMPKNKRYPNTWQGILNMLNDSSNTDTAEQLEAAVNATNSDFHDTYDEDAPARVVGQQQVQAQQPQVATAQAPAEVVGQQVPAQQPQVPAAQVPAGVAGQPQVEQQTQLAAAQGKRKKMNRYELAEWLEEQGVDENDVKLFKERGVNEMFFLRMEEGSKQMKDISEITVSLLDDLKKDLQSK